MSASKKTKKVTTMTPNQATAQGIDFSTARYVELPPTQSREPSKAEKRFKQKARDVIERMRHQGRLPRRTDAL